MIQGIDIQITGRDQFVSHEINFLVGDKQQFKNELIAF